MKFENLCTKFNSKDPEDIKEKFVHMTLSNLSYENQFNDLQ